LIDMKRTLPDDDGAAERLAWLRLARCEGVGALTFARLLERFGSAGRALDALPELRARGTWSVGRPPETGTLEAELDGLAKAGGRLLTSGESGFPDPLRHIPDPPPVLSLRGSVEALRGPAVAVIGARNASANGCVLARRFAAELARAGLVVVSGLARGIDTAAHEGALEAGGLTVAAVAGGVDVVYPPENEGLVGRIVESGAVVSERPLGTVARARDFPRRNRIIAGLSLGVVVVEAAPQSGSLITARLAAEQGREVMAVPGSPLDPRHRGTNQLLREGATLVESASDVLGVLRPLMRHAAAPAAPGRRPAPRAAAEPASPPRPAGPAPPPPDGLAAALVTRLGHEPLAVDELVRQCGAPFAQVQSVLLDLELEGRVDRHPGNRVALRAG
jgi:DNA processing protein